MIYMLITSAWQTERPHGVGKTVEGLKLKDEARSMLSGSADIQARTTE